MKVNPSIAAALLLVLAAPATAHGQLSGAPEASQGVSPQALKLAEILISEDLLLASGLKLGERAFFASVQTDEAAKELEAQFPGIYLAVWAKVEPELRRWILLDRPLFRKQVATLYAARLSLSEIDALLRFYTTPTGKKMIRIMHQNVDPDPLVVEVNKRDGTKISAEALRASTASANAKVLEAIGAEDVPALRLFMQTMPLTKIKSAAADVEKLTLSSANARDPAFAARIKGIIKQEIDRYNAEHPAR